MASRSKRVRLAIEKAELILRRTFDIKRVLQIKSGGWNAFFDEVTEKIDPRLHAGDFDPFKKHYPRNLEELDVLAEGRK
jgi:hypothetical protein